MVGTDVAQMVEAPEPACEYSPIADAVFLCNGVLVTFTHAAKKLGQRTEVPYFAGNPYGDRQAIPFFVVVDEMFF